MTNITQNSEIGRSQDQLIPSHHLYFQVTKMLFMVVILFGICWFPFQVFNILSTLQFSLRWVQCSLMTNKCQAIICVRRLGNSKIVLHSLSCRKKALRYSFNVIA